MSEQDPNTDDGGIDGLADDAEVDTIIRALRQDFKHGNAEAMKADTLDLLDQLRDVRLKEDPRFSVWLANCAYGYGFGYTDEQALAAMAANVPGESTPVTVDLVQHHGDASMGPATWEVAELVGGYRIEVPAKELNTLRDSAIGTQRAAERALEAGDRIETFDPEED